MLTNQGFEVLVASGPDYDRLTAEIYHDGRFVALVSQEREAGLFDVETPGVGLVESLVARKVDAAGLIEAIRRACDRLKR